MADVRLTATNPEDSSVVPVACNAKGELLLEEIPDNSFDGNLQGDLTVSGSASIAESIETGFHGIAVDNEGSSSQNEAFAIDSAPGNQVYTRKITFTTDGSGEFARSVSSNYLKVFNGNNNPGTVAVFTGGQAGRGLRIGINAFDGNDTNVSLQAGSLTTGSKLNFTTADKNGTVKQVVIGKTDGQLMWGTSNGAQAFNISSSGQAVFNDEVYVTSRSKLWRLVEQNGLCHMVEYTKAGTADLVAPEAADYPPLRDVFAELDAIEKALGEVMERLRMNPPAGWEVWDGSNEGTDRA